LGLSLGPDEYAVNLAAGDTVTISTATPSDQAGEFVNTLDPVIELRNPNRALVATDDNSGPDGRNALLSYTAYLTGTYAIRVVGAAETAGEYVLEVSGHTGPASSFEIIAADPGHRDVLPTAPATMTVQFNDSMLLTSLEASDLTVDGTPAVAVEAVDGRTAMFTLPALDEGAHEAVITAGQILDVQGTPVQAFTAVFSVDADPFMVEGFEVVEDTGGVPDDRITNDTTPLLVVTFGRAAYGPQQSVSVLDPNSLAVPATVATDGVDVWLVTIPPGSLTVDGEYSVVLRGDMIVDGTGELLNGGYYVVLHFTLDTHAPTLTVYPMATQDTTPLLFGTVDDPAVAVRVQLAGDSYSAVNHMTGTWTLADNAIYPPLSRGVYDVQVTATDLAGNTGVDTSVDELIIYDVMGDANLDGLVDTQDFSILKANFGRSANWLGGNFNGDTVVDVQDFSILKVHFGEGGAPGSAPAAAPTAEAGALQEAIAAAAGDIRIGAAPAALLPGPQAAVATGKNGDSLDTKANLPVTIITRTSLGPAIAPAFDVARADKAPPLSARLVHSHVATDASHETVRDADLVDVLAESQAKFSLIL